MIKHLTILLEVELLGFHLLLSEEGGWGGGGSEGLFPYVPDFSLREEYLTHTPSSASSFSQCRWQPSLVSGQLCQLLQVLIVT